MNRILWLVGLIGLASLGWAQPSDQIFPDGPVTSGTQAGIGTKRSVTPYGTVVTSVTQALLPWDLQRVTEAGAVTTLGITITSGTIVAPDFDEEIGGDPAFPVRPAKFRLGTDIQERTRLIHPADVPPRPATAIEQEPVDVFDAEWAWDTTTESPTPQTRRVRITKNGVLEIWRNGEWGNYDSQGGTFSNGGVASSQRVRVVDGTDPDFEGLSTNAFGTVVADRALVTAGDSHTNQKSYARYFICGPFRQLQGNAAGSILWSRYGNHTDGEDVTKPMGLLDTDDATSSVVIDGLHGTTNVDVRKPLQVQGRRVESILATDMTVRTVAADTNDWAEFSFTIPAALHATGASVSVDVRGVMDGFVLDDNSYNFQVRVEGTAIINTTYSQAALDPCPWYARVTLAATGATTGTASADFFPHDPNMSGNIRPDATRGTYTGTSGDVAVVVRIQRAGSIADETATMDYSVARFIPAP